MKLHTIDYVLILLFGVAAPLGILGFPVIEQIRQHDYGTLLLAMVLGLTAITASLLASHVRMQLRLRRTTHPIPRAFNQRLLINSAIPQHPDDVHGLFFWELFFELAARHRYSDSGSIEPADEETIRQWDAWTHDARERALNWSECACCELATDRRVVSKLFNPVHSRHMAPMNPQLEHLGAEFSKRMQARDWRKAEDAYYAIQTMVKLENYLSCKELANP